MNFAMKNDCDHALILMYSICISIKFLSGIFLDDGSKGKSSQ